MCVSQTGTIFLIGHVVLGGCIAFNKMIVFEWYFMYLYFWEKLKKKN